MILEQVKGRNLPDELKDCLVRPDSPDTEMLRDCGNVYSSIDFKGAIVLDLGANIGGLSVLAARRGAKKVYAVEPLPHNLEVLRCQSRRDEQLDRAIEIIPAAVWTSDGEIQFTLPSSKKGLCSAHISSIRKRGGEQVTVATVEFNQLMRDLQPTVVKMDIEGAEYDVLENAVFPDSVEWVAIEWHRMSQESQERFTTCEPKFTSWKRVYRRAHKIFGLQDACVECVYRTQEGSRRNFSDEINRFL